MGRTKSTGTTGIDQTDEALTPGREPIDKYEIFESIGISREMLDDPERFHDVFQLSVKALYEDQFAATKKLQNDYLKRLRPLPPIDDLRMLKIAADLAVIAYSVKNAVDPNVAARTLEREGYEIAGKESAE